jgi:hypothetical protein
MDPVPETNSSPLLFSEALTEKPPTVLGELWLLVRITGKWWLVPILLVLLLLGAVVLLSATCYAPFIYTLF